MNTSYKLTILSFNCLAPCYAQPKWYYPENEVKLDKIYRRERIIKLLTRDYHNNSKLKLYEQPDIISLQEVTDDTIEIINGITYNREGEYKYFKSVLENDYYCKFYPHDKTYWESYFSSDPTSPYAYIKNGNALFLKKKSFSEPIWFDKSNSLSGNHSVYAETIHLNSGKKLRINNVHFDSDVGGNRLKELESLLSFLVFDNNIIDLIIGDFNASTEQANLKQLLVDKKFTNILKFIQDELGYNVFEQTHPFTSQYNGNNVYGPIDHILYRGDKILPDLTILVSGTKLNINLKSQRDEIDFDIFYPPGPDRIHGEPSDTINGVLDHNLWETSLNEIDRINNNFDYCGSDHFPIIASFKI